MLQLFLLPPNKTLSLLSNWYSSIKQWICHREKAILGILSILSRYFKQTLKVTIYSAAQKYVENTLHIFE